jgi:hypothetical protein
MRFGIYAEIQCPPEMSHYDLTWEIVRQMIHADAVGFDSYSVIEYHFFPQFGISANPLAMFVAAAQHTLGFASALVPRTPAPQSLDPRGRDCGGQPAHPRPLGMWAGTRARLALPPGQHPIGGESSAL